MIIYFRLTSRTTAALAAMSIHKCIPNNNCNSNVLMSVTAKNSI